MFLNIKQKEDDPLTIKWDWDEWERPAVPDKKAEPLYTEGQKVFTKGGIEATIDKLYKKYPEFTYTISFEKAGRKYATTIKESSLGLTPFEPEPVKPKRDHEAIRQKMIQKAEEQKKRADLIGRLVEVSDPESDYFKQWGYIFLKEEVGYYVEFVSVTGAGVFAREQLKLPHYRKKGKTKDYYPAWKSEFIE